MIWNDLVMVLQWWLVWLGMGLVGWPLVRVIFHNWDDQGYTLAKIVGMAGVTFTVFVLSVLHIVPFSVTSVWLASVVFLAIGIGITAVARPAHRPRLRVVVMQEVLFLALLVGWAYVKGHESTINGLEKFMDFGFTRSILQTQYMPPADMWYAGQTINYYYFGHFMMAVATRLSGLDLVYTFNIMLATIFALCFSTSFSIARQLFSTMGRVRMTIASLFVAYLVTFGGNLQTIYAFTSGYSGHEDDPPKFWKVLINPLDAEARKAAWEGYWYPNATRFIPYTIHEFPSYSFVVSDLHGHVLDIPLALLGIAFLLDQFWLKPARRLSAGRTIFFGWIAGLMFMTNALDGPIYLGIFVLLAGWEAVEHWANKKELYSTAGKGLLLAGVFVVTTLPFMAHFKSFVSGIAVNCPPEALANSKIGPLLFEGVEKCQHSPAWMLFILWGFFVYCGIWMLDRHTIADTKQRRVFGLLFVVCLGLILFAEFLYFKDIYPQHFRSNTMFKLGYQAFMILAILSGYTIVQILGQVQQRTRKLVFTLGLAPLLYLVIIYPLFSVKSYFGKIEWGNYKGLYGMSWMETKYPDNLAAISWLQEQTVKTQPIILEASGDSYTDYDQISVFTGLPTIAGWTVHEWLWRDGYDPIAKRAEEVRQVYEASEVSAAKAILEKYHVKYLILGALEREKYPQLNEEIIMQLGRPVFTRPTITVYQVM